MRPLLMESAVERLKALEDGEFVEFECEKQASMNLQTFLYWALGEQSLTELMERNEKVLDKYPRNLSALVMKMRLLAEVGKNVDAMRVYEEINAIVIPAGKPSIAMMRCEAEVARSYHFLGHQFYWEAIPVYESVISKLEEHMMTEQLDSYELNEVMSLCRFRLAQSYKRLLCKGCLSALMEKGKNVPIVYKHICDNLTKIIDGDQETFKGRAMIELIEAHQKYAYITKQTLEFAYPNEGLKSFVEEAVRIAPEDPYVLEHCGKFYRQQASETKELVDFERALELLDRCTQLSEINHVTWHQKGTLYLQLAHIKRLQGYGTYGQGKIDSPSSARQRVHQQQGAQRMSGGEGGLQNFSYRNELFQAKECLEKACEITCYNRCRYLSDLSRVCMHLSDPKGAEEALLKGKTLIGCVDQVDQGDESWLYHQWTIFANKQLKGYTSKYADSKYTKDIKMMYRKAIRSALVARNDKKHTKQSYELLLQILSKETQRDSDNEAIAFEYQLVKDVMGVYDRDDLPIPLLWLADNRRELTLRLIRCLANRADRERYDGNAAFFYLTVLAKAGKLQEVDCETALGIARNSYDEDGIPGAFLYPLRDVFRWYLNECATNRQTSSEDADTKSPADTFDVYVLTNSDEKCHQSDVQHVMDILQKRLGLFVARISPDVLRVPGTFVQEMELKTAAVVVVEEDTAGSASSAGWQPMEPVLELVRKEGAVAMKCCVSAESTSTGCGRFLEDWADVVISPSTDHSEAAYSLVTALIKSALMPIGV